MKWFNWIPGMSIEFGPEPIKIAKPKLAEVKHSTDKDWLDAQRYIAERIKMQQRVLERIGLSHEETDGARYAIVELKALLNFKNSSKMAGNE